MNFKFWGRSKRIEAKLDEVLAKLDYSPVDAGSSPLRKFSSGLEPILMTDEREDKIAKDLHQEEGDF